MRWSRLAHSGKEQRRFVGIKYRTLWDIQQERGGEGGGGGGTHGDDPVSHLQRAVTVGSPTLGDPGDEDALLAEKDPRTKYW